MRFASFTNVQNGCTIPSALALVWRLCHALYYRPLGNKWDGWSWRTACVLVRSACDVWCVYPRAFLRLSLLTAYSWNESFLCKFDRSDSCNRPVLSGKSKWFLVSLRGIFSVSRKYFQTQISAEQSSRPDYYWNIGSIFSTCPLWNMKAF